VAANGGANVFRLEAKEVGILKRVLLLLTVGALVATAVMVSTAGSVNAEVVLATLSQGGWWSIDVGGWWNFGFFDQILSSILSLFNSSSILGV
jgi:hypothetical protein